MKSVQAKTRKILEKREAALGKKGQVVDTALTVIITLFVGILIVFAILFGLSSLSPLTFFAAGSAERQSVNESIRNFTNGIEQFFQQIPAAMKILGVVLIIGFLALLIAIVVRFRSNAGVGGGGGL